MRVVVDGCVFENSHQIGIRRAFYEIIWRITDRIDCTLWLRARPAAPLPPGVRIVRDRGRTLPSRWNLLSRAYNRWARTRYPREVRDANVFHSTYFTPCPCDGPAVVVSVYDMIAEMAFPYSGGDHWAGHIRDKGAAILSATLCIALSNATAADLIRFYPQVAERVRVVPLGADHMAGDPEHENTKLASPSEPFALFVGYRHGYKNFHTVLDAVRSATWPVGLTLFVVGSALADFEVRLIEALGIKSRIRDLGRVSDADLRRLYATARCFVFPSFLEGFGLPVVEAQTNGCPAVLSDIPVFREVAGQAAVFFDPRIGERLAAAVAEACEPDIRHRLVEAGRENARRYSWDRTAAGYAAAYEEAARAVGR